MKLCLLEGSETWLLVVSINLVYSFAEQFYKVYSDDLPVFISADSILHAWHHSYDKTLEDLEEISLSPALGSILAAMSDNVVRAYEEAKGTVLEECVLDADFFVSVAQSLLSNSTIEGKLKQGARIKKALSAVKAEKMDSM